MSERFAPKEALGLYGLVLAGSFLFFVLGVYVGRESRPAPAALTDPRETESTTEPEPELEFYEKLVPREGQTPATAETNDGQRQAAPEAADAKPQAGSAQATLVPSPPSPAKPLPANYFTVQVAALATRDEAAQIVLRLEAKAYPSQVISPEPGNSYFRVWVGEAMTRREAELLAERLKKDGFHTYVKPVRRN